MKNNFAKLATAVMFAMMASAASAAPFTLLIFESSFEVAKRADVGENGKAYWNSYALFADEAGRAGVLRGGSALAVSDDAAAVVDAGIGGDRTSAFDAKAPLRLSGYFQIDVADLEAAVSWAEKIPAAATGHVEVRAGYPVPGMK